MALKKTKFKGISPSEQRRWVLLRKVSDVKTLAFNLTIEVEEDPDAKGSFGATVKELPGTVNAVEESGLAAEESAISLFKEMVDHCLATKISLNDLFSEAIGDILTQLDCPLDQALKAIGQVLQKLEKGSAASDSSDWLKLAA